MSKLKLMSTHTTKPSKKLPGLAFKRYGGYFDVVHLKSGLPVWRSGLPVQSVRDTQAILEEKLSRVDWTQSADSLRNAFENKTRNSAAGVLSSLWDCLESRLVKKSGYSVNQLVVKESCRRSRK